MQTDSLISGLSWFDAVAAATLAAGLIRGRKIGMSGELLPLLKWILVVAAAGFGYHLAGDWMIPALSPEWAHRLSYGAVAAITAGALSGVQRALGNKLVGSDFFGKSEFILGMLAGILQFACIFVLVFSFFNARVPTEKEIADLQAKNQDNFGNTFFNPLKVHHAIVMESLSGRLIRDYLGLVIIQAEAPTSLDFSDTMGKRREKMVSDVMNMSSTNAPKAAPDSNVRFGAAGIATNTPATPRPSAALSFISKSASNAAPSAKSGTNAAPQTESFFSSLLRKLGFSGDKTAPPTNTAAIAKTNNASLPKSASPGQKGSTNAGAPGPAKTATNITISVAASSPAAAVAPEPLTNTAPSSETILEPPAGTNAAPTPSPSTGLTELPATNAAPAAPLTNAPAPTNASPSTPAPFPAVASSESSNNAPAAAVPEQRAAPVFVPSPVLISTNGITISRSKVVKAVKPAKTTNAPAAATNAPVKKP